MSRRVPIPCTYCGFAIPAWSESRHCFGRGLICPCGDAYCDRWCQRKKSVNTNTIAVTWRWFLPFHLTSSQSRSLQRGSCRISDLLANKECCTGRTLSTNLKMRDPAHALLIDGPYTERMASVANQLRCQSRWRWPCCRLAGPSLC